MEELTVFTPTYNREKTLVNLYKSLCRQKYQNFIWLIIDDGSVDNTENIVKNWQEEGKIKIQYIKQKNGGKYKAVNTGVKNCKTELFAFIDSDDYYLDNSLEIMMTEWENVKSNQKVAAIVGRKQKTDGTIVGKSIDLNKTVINENKLTKKFGYIGDTCRVYRTKILKEHLYPEVEDKFMPECVMFSPINNQYDIYFINTPLSVIEYLEEGYSKNRKKILLNNPTGNWIALNTLIKSKQQIKLRIKNAISYVLWSWIHNIKNSFKKCNNKLLYIISLPIASILYLLKIPKWYYKKGENSEQK